MAGYRPHGQEKGLRRARLASAGPPALRSVLQSSLRLPRPSGAADREAPRRTRQVDAGAVRRLVGEATNSFRATRTRHRGVARQNRAAAAHPK